ncbi:alanine racemase [Maritalea porphyrae]|uniref:alanine racemase n=1 Tax=Maritalea porphyrae TaxID=880732 RepID=UPI0022AF8460|nr:alanine racemase [Maritalea porphyrae]MCZ4271287.1 alanine racemase [Maritalea porphyrae]
MFLDLIRRRNPKLIETAIALHQAGKIPANAYVLDLDAVEHNAAILRAEGDRLGMKVFAMTKQVGRNSGFCQAAVRGGVDRAVAVDVACAVACTRAGLPVGHVGHLVQVPKFEADLVASYIKPDYWTIFSIEKAREAAAAAKKAGRVQDLLVRIKADGDTFYSGHEGGVKAEEIVAFARVVDQLDGARFAGITTFPALLFNQESNEVLPTHNLSTLEAAAMALVDAGYNDIEINAPGTTSSVVLEALANAGATQCEPGNALHGTTPLHAVKDLPELPAAVYLSEVSHLHEDKAYCFGGGLYIDPVFPDYDLKAIVSSTPTAQANALASVEIPPTSAIDYYGMIDATQNVSPKSGDSVVFGFRGQAFVKRGYTVGVSGISKVTPKVVTIENIFGQEEAWPNLR